MALDIPPPTRLWSTQLGGENVGLGGQRNLLLHSSLEPVSLAMGLSSPSRCFVT